MNIGEYSEKDKKAFKETVAGMNYTELLEIFMRAPKSADRDHAIDLLGKAFHDHLSLWVALPRLASD